MQSFHTFIPRLVWRSDWARIWPLFIHSFFFSLSLFTNNKTSHTLLLVYYGTQHRILFLWLFCGFINFSVKFRLFAVLFTLDTRACCLHYENSTMTDFVWMRTRIQRESKSNSLCTMEYKRTFSFYFIWFGFYVSFVIIEMATRIKHTNTFERKYTNRLPATEKDKHISYFQCFWWDLWVEWKRQLSTLDLVPILNVSVVPKNVLNVTLPSICIILFKFSVENNDFWEWTIQNMNNIYGWMRDTFFWNNKFNKIIHFFTKNKYFGTIDLR